MIFLSTPSARRATAELTKRYNESAISIHALREEGDVQRLMQLRGVVGISIHALREEGDNLAACNFGFCQQISIHALREEGDAGY